MTSEVRDAARALVEARGLPQVEPTTPTHFITESGASVQELEGGRIDLDLEAIARGLANWMADPPER